MGNYGRTSGTGGPGSAAITNDDEFTLDLPDQDDPTETELRNHVQEGWY